MRQRYDGCTLSWLFICLLGLGFDNGAVCNDFIRPRILYPSGLYVGVFCLLSLSKMFGPHSCYHSDGELSLVLGIMP